MKNSVKKITALSACVLSAAMCLGSLAACQNNNGPKVVHTEAQAATCTVDGNTEYWTKGGKYYSDADCTEEITLEDTVIPALDHDFEHATYVTTDRVQHWKVCAREGCNETTTKENHTFTDGECTVCQKTNGFTNTDKEGALTREDTATSVKFTVGQSSADYEAKITYTLSGIEVDNAYVVKYKFKSSAAGSVNFETYGDDKNNTFNLAVNEGENVITAYGIMRDAENTTAVLKVGTLSGAVLEFTSITCENLTLNNVAVDNYNLVSSPKTVANDGVDEPISATKTPHEGWFNISSTKGPADAWRIKLEHNLSVVKDKVYDMVYVIRVNTLQKNENLELEIAAGTFANDNAKRYWLDKTNETLIVKFRFTANATNASQYSDLQLGNLATQDNKGFSIDFLYIGLIEVA